MQTARSKWVKVEDGLSWLELANEALESTWVIKSQLRHVSVWAAANLAESQNGQSSQLRSGH